MGLALALVVGGIVVHDVQFLRVRRLDLASAKIDAPVRVLQVSDFHNGHGPGPDRVLRAVRKAHPDVVVLTGDLANTHDDTLEPLRRLLAGLGETRIPVYAIWGNHDHWSHGLGRLGALLRSHGVDLLTNESRSLVVNGQRVNLVGTDDYASGHGDLGRAMTGVDPSRLTLVISHSPEMRAALPHPGVDLVMVGHTHGGQARVPGVGCVVAPNQGWWPRYCAGLYDIGGTPMWIDSGVGWSGRPVRFLVQAQVTLLEVRPAARR